MHFKLLVIGEDVEGLMLPYSEHLDDNAEGRWDYYSVGGRWSGELTLKPGRSGYRNKTTQTGMPVERCDSARRGDLELDRVRREAHSAAAERWSTYERLSDENPEWQSLADLLAAHDADTARRTYREQPMVKALSAAGIVTLFGLAEHEYGGYTGEQYRERATLDALAGWATLSVDGWIDKRCPWGASEEAKRDAEMVYLRETNTRLDAAADSELVTVVDYHS